MDVAAADAVDVIKLTPSHLALLVRIGLEGSRIRRMILGGENLTTRTAAAASNQLGDHVARLVEQVEVDGGIVLAWLQVGSVLLHDQLESPKSFLRLLHLDRFPRDHHASILQAELQGLVRRE